MGCYTNTPKALVGLERARRRPRKAIEGVEKKGGRGRLDRRAKGVKKVEIIPID